MTIKNVVTQILITTTVLFCSSVCFSQAPIKTGSGSVAGRVTAGEKGVADVVVVATASATYDNRTLARATTDDDGNYRIGGLAVGSYRIVPVAPSYAMPRQVTIRNQAGQSVTIAEGEAVTNINFKLMRGGVITGRVTDAEGNPIIGEPVLVTKKDAEEDPYQYFNRSRNRTDDRGVYRVYGLAAGNYKVSVGQARSGRPSTAMGRMGGQYLKTYYPGTIEDAKATVLEVKEGAEISNIDFSVGKAPTGFSISGRVVDGATGLPAPNITVGYSLVDKGNQQQLGFQIMPTTTDANGKFIVEGLQPGSYAAFAIQRAEVGRSNSTYSDLTRFEIVDGDVTGIQIKLRRGVTITGTAVMENNSDPAVLATLQNVRLYAYTEQKEPAPPSYGDTRILPDGSFSFSGLGPGKVRIGVQDYPQPPKSVHLLRMEVNGLAQDMIDAKAGDDITGIRLVFTHGSGTLRGRVKLEGGAMPEGATMWIALTPGETARPHVRVLEVDARGQFFTDNIRPGTYELKTRVIQDRREIPGFPSDTRSVTIVDGVETEVNIVLTAVPKP